MKDFDVVNYVLAAALKADKLEPENLGLVMTYLILIDAPDLYFQYVILRMSQNLGSLKLYDISMLLDRSNSL